MFVESQFDVSGSISSSKVLFPTLSVQIVGSHCPIEMSPLERPVLGNMAARGHVVTGYLKHGKSNQGAHIQMIFNFT